MKNKKPVIVFILGPTGVGKSEFAVALARRIGGEIISCDSMQIYKGMPIMSQQPSLELRKMVPHYLVGMLHPSKEWSAADFVSEADKIAGKIIGRKKIPIITGGTGLYARAFIKGLFPSPPRDEALRRALYKEAEAKGRDMLYERLRKIDPLYAAKIHPNDLRRIVRALEVYELTGKPISEKHIETKGIGRKYKISVFILNREREELYRRIDECVKSMFESGIAEEVKRLGRLKVSRTAKAVLGYREVSEYIAGKRSMEEAKELLKRKTRHYAKRQMTWFRKERGARWLELSGGAKDSLLIDSAAKQIRMI